MLSINNGCKSILKVVINNQQQCQNILRAGYAVKAGKKGKGKGKSEEDEDRSGGDSKYDIKVSKASYQKIIQRFTTAWRRPDSINTNRSDEEKEIRQFIYEFGKYSEKISKLRDFEESEKVKHQWDAIMELPEDLRKIALLVDTHDEQPSLIPLLFDTPPTKVDPKSTIQLKKKDKSLKPSQRLILNNSTQS